MSEPTPDPPSSLVVVYEDPYLLAVVKPAGLLTQRNATGQATLEEAVRRYLAPDDPGSVYLGTVHRLDRPVSGLVLWARTPKAAKRLAGQFERRTPEKTYWAIVEPLDPTVTTALAPALAGIWEDWLAGSSDPRGVVAVLGPEAPGARRALTECGPLPEPVPFEVPAGLVGLELRPRTGRTHQLRAQAAARGCPIWGDTAYGGRRSFATGAIALHARSLRFVHPGSLETLTVTAPLPETWPARAAAP